MDPRPHAVASDCQTAIAAHAAWRERLAYAIGHRGAGLDVAEIAADDRCDLGRMLTLLGPGHDPDLVGALRGEHARFHAHAARIVQMAADGRVAAAQRAMQGEYELISAELVALLRALANGR